MCIPVFESVRRATVQSQRLLNTTVMYFDSRYAARTRRRNKSDVEPIDMVPETAIIVKNDFSKLQLLKHDTTESLGEFGS